MDCIVHGVVKSRTRLSDFHFTFICYITLMGILSFIFTDVINQPLMFSFLFFFYLGKIYIYLLFFLILFYF